MIILIILNLNLGSGMSILIGRMSILIMLHFPIQ